MSDFQLEQTEVIRNSPETFHAFCPATEDKVNLKLADSTFRLHDSVTSLMASMDLSAVNFLGDDSTHARPAQKSNDRWLDTYFESDDNEDQGDDGVSVDAALHRSMDLVFSLLDEDTNDEETDSRCNSVTEYWGSGSADSLDLISKRIQPIAVKRNRDENQKDEEREWSYDDMNDVYDTYSKYTIQLR